MSGQFLHALFLAIARVISEIVVMAFAFVMLACLIGWLLEFVICPISRRISYRRRARRYWRENGGRYVPEHWDSRTGGHG